MQLCSYINLVFSQTGLAKCIVGYMWRDVQAIDVQGIRVGKLCGIELL